MKMNLVILKTKKLLINNHFRNEIIITEMKNLIQKALI